MTYISVSAIDILENGFCETVLFISASLQKCKEIREALPKNTKTTFFEINIFVQDSSEATIKSWGYEVDKPMKHFKDYVKKQGLKG